MGNGPLHYDQQLDSSFTKHANVSRMVPTYQRSPSNVVLYLQNKILYLIAVVFQIIDVWNTTAKIYPIEEILRIFFSHSASNYIQN